MEKTIETTIMEEPVYDAESEQPTLEWRVPYVDRAPSEQAIFMTTNRYRIDRSHMFRLLTLGQLACYEMVLQAHYLPVNKAVEYHCCKQTHTQRQVITSNTHTHTNTPSGRRSYCWDNCGAGERHFVLAQAQVFMFAGRARQCHRFWKRRAHPCSGATSCLLLSLLSPFVNLSLSWASAQTRVALAVQHLADHSTAIWQC